MCGTPKHICLGIYQPSLMIEEGHITRDMLRLNTCLKWVVFHQKTSKHNRGGKRYCYFAFS